MTRPVHPRKHDAFVLLLTVFLVALLAATGAGLSLTAMTESVNTQRRARTLQHELALDSLLEVLPGLRDDADSLVQIANNDVPLTLELEVGPCHVTAQMRSEGSKWNVPRDTSGEAVLAQLRALALSNGLPQDGVRVRPIVNRDDESSKPPLVWFDQLVDQTAFEELFHWRLTKEVAPLTKRKKCWSDLVTFWGDAAGEVVSLEVETRIGDDARTWYVVATIEGDEAKALYRGSVE